MSKSEESQSERSEESEDSERSSSVIDSDESDSENVDDSQESNHKEPPKRKQGRADRSVSGSSERDEDVGEDSQLDPRAPDKNFPAVKSSNSRTSERK